MIRIFVGAVNVAPFAGLVMLTDGGDNTGGVDRETIAQLRQLRLPVHTIGFGPDHFNKDIELEDAAIPARALPTSRLVARVTLRQHGYTGEKVTLKLQPAPVDSGIKFKRKDLEEANKYFQMALERQNKKG